jgi:hypothetical protein
MDRADTFCIRTHLDPDLLLHSKALHLTATHLLSRLQAILHNHNSVATIPHNNNMAVDSVHLLVNMAQDPDFKACLHMVLLHQATTVHHLVRAFQAGLLTNSHLHLSVLKASELPLASSKDHHQFNKKIQPPNQHQNYR